MWSPRRSDAISCWSFLLRCRRAGGLEASGSAHHWARELIKLGHDARMMPPAYVKPYIRRQKNDAADAAAICEAVTRPSMRFVGVRSLKPGGVDAAQGARDAGLATHAAAQRLARPPDRGRRDRPARAQTRPRTGRVDRSLRWAPLEACEALAPLVVQLRNLDEAIARLERIIAKLRRRTKRRAG